MKKVEKCNEKWEKCGEKWEKCKEKWKKCKEKWKIDLNLQMYFNLQKLILNYNSLCDLEHPE